LPAAWCRRSKLKTDFDVNFLFGTRFAKDVPLVFHQALLEQSG
jgi:hypothetical protein